MKPYNFSVCPDRHHTGALKWNKYAGTDVLPMWVADMDFVSAPEIVSAMQARLDHGVFGYTKPYDSLNEAVVAYQERAHGRTIDPRWLVWLPGLVQALNVLSRAIGEPGDSVMTCTPVYPPFLSAPPWQNRELITAPLVCDGERWHFDWEAMEQAVQPNTRVFILCHPHNPVGRVWRRDELEQVGAFCRKHDLILCSDEIHCDLILDDDVEFVTTAHVEGIEDRLITLMAPSKTWNLPGLSCSFAIIPDPTLRAKFNRAMRGVITEMNCMGYAACEAAYRQGEPWRQAVVEVLRSNRDALYAFLAAEAPEIPMQHMEATYLAWLDVRALGLDDPVGHFEAHGIGLSNGADFGTPGWVRWNLGCPPAMMEQGFARFKAGLDAARQAS